MVEQERTKEPPSAGEAEPEGVFHSMQSYQFLSPVHSLLLEEPQITILIRPGVQGQVRIYIFIYLLSPSILPLKFTLPTPFSQKGYGGPWY